MVTTESHANNYLTTADNGRAHMLVDAPRAKGGGEQGFGPHELLEAALATCINIAVRMEAVARGIALEGVTSKVRLERSEVSVARFEYVLTLAGDLTAVDRKALQDAADSCPVRKTLSKTIQFQACNDRSPA